MVRTYMVAGLVCCALAAGCCHPKAPASTVDDGAVDVRARDVLAAMGEALTDAAAFSVSAEGVMDETLDDGTPVRLHRKSTIHMRRPDRLYVRTVGDDVDRICWYNGRTVTVLDKQGDRYASAEAPDTVEAMLDRAVERHGLTIPVADLLFNDPHIALLTDVHFGDYLGVRSMDGRRCHHLAFRQELIDWQIWIDAGDTPVPRKLVITYKTEPGYPEYSVSIDSWDLSAELGDGVFEFSQPFEATAVTMDDLLGIAEGE